MIAAIPLRHCALRATTGCLRRNPPSLLRTARRNSTPSNPSPGSAAHCAQKPDPIAAILHAIRRTDTEWERFPMNSSEARRRLATFRICVHAPVRPPPGVAPDASEEFLLRKDSGRVDAPGRRLARVAIRPFESPMKTSCPGGHPATSPCVALRSLTSSISSCGSCDASCALHRHSPGVHSGSLFAPGCTAGSTAPDGYLSSRLTGQIGVTCSRWSAVRSGLCGALYWRATPCFSR
jgi:hypothetical protein